LFKILEIPVVGKGVNHPGIEIEEADPLSNKTLSLGGKGDALHHLNKEQDPNLEESSS
jgi:hypothetical protein